MQTAEDITLQLKMIGTTFLRTIFQTPDFPVWMVGWNLYKKWKSMDVILLLFSFFFFSLLLSSPLLFSLSLSFEILSIFQIVFDFLKGYLIILYNWEITTKEMLNYIAFIIFNL